MAAGLLDFFALQPQQGGGLLGQGNWFGDNRNAIIAAGLGLASGNGWGEGATNALKGAISGQAADQMQAASRAALPHIMSRDDLDPAVKAAFMRNPTLAANYLTALAKPPEYKFEKAGPYYGPFNPQSGQFRVQGATPETHKIGPEENVVSITPPMPGRPPQPVAQPPQPSPAMQPPAPQAAAPPADPSFAERFSGEGVRPIIKGGVSQGTISKLADDFRADKNVQRYQTIQPIIASAREAATRPGGAADLNLIYAFAKIVDPESVVREGETVMVQRTGSLPDWVVGQIERMNSGQGMTEQVRKKLLVELESRVGGLQRAHDSATEFYRRRAVSAGIDPSLIIYAPQMYEPPTVAPPNPNYSANFGGEILGMSEWQTIPNSPARIRERPR